MSTENEHEDDEREDESQGSDDSDTDDRDRAEESDTAAESDTAGSSDDADSSDDEAARSDAETSDGAADDAPPARASSAAGAAAGRASAGARLAAAKAAKAAKKAAKKQTIREEAGLNQQSQFERARAAEPKDAQEILTQSPLGRAATRAGEWAEANRQIALGVAAVAAIAVVGWLGWTSWTSNQAEAAGQLLEQAIEISNAEIVDPDAEPAEPAEPEATAAEPTAAEPEAPTYATLEARNEAALAAYRRVSTEYPGASAATWAKLGEGRTLLEQGAFEDARAAYEAAFHGSGDETVIAWQALEGIGASYEAEANWSEATTTYDRLTGIADGAYASVASYHLARMHAASGDDGAALTAFRELVDSLQGDAEGGEPPFPYVLAQATLRLRELDPSAGGATPSPLARPDGAGTGIDGLEGMDPEQLQELIRQLQTKSGGGAH